MKPFLLLLVLLGTTPSFAQYESIFGQNSTQWIFEWGNLFGTTQDTIYVIGDTTFQGKDWKITDCSCFSYIESYLSEDTTTGQVWYKRGYNASVSYQDTFIKLSFDFSIQKGDFFDISGTWGTLSSGHIDSSHCYPTYKTEIPR